MKTHLSETKRMNIRSLGKGVALLATVLLLMFISSHAFSQCAQLVWSDEFNGTAVDPNKWEFQIGTGPQYGVPDGWGNNERQYYRAENARVVNGNLEITTKHETYGNKPYTSTRMRTLGKASWQYGRFEARIQMPSAQGVWPAFWMLPDHNNWPSTGEIDIMEAAGKNINYNLGTLHYYANGGHQQTHNPAYYGTPPPVNFSAGFHVFAVEWSPNQIKFFVDGNLYATNTPASMVAGAWPFNAQKFHILLNVAVGGNFGGADNPADYPTTMKVDYVRMYTLGTNCNNNIAPTVSLTSPANGQTFTAPANITVSANATDSDGSISKVDFYHGNTLIGTDNTAPYSIAWNNVAAGTYTLTAKATDNAGAVTTSASSTITVNTTPNPVPDNLALRKPAFSSSNESGSLIAANATDGSLSTRWSSAFSDPQWIYVDLGSNYSVNRVKINWEAAYGKDYQIQTSNDAANWTTIKAVTGNASLTNDWTGLSGTGRYVRIYGTARGTVYGFSIYEIEVYGTQTNTSTGCDGTAANGDYTYNVSSSGNNVSFTFTPGAPIAGTSMVILNYKVGGATTYAGVYMDKAGTNFTKTIAIASGTTVTFYFTYRVGTTTVERNSSATPHTYVSGTSCTSARMGVQDLTAEDQTAITVYPNPVAGDLNVLLTSSGNETISMVLTNLLSVNVLQVTSILEEGINNIKLDVSGLENGLYILTITRGDKSELKKIQVQK